MTGYFRWLLPALLLSALLIAVRAVAPGLPNWVGLTPVAPLIAYHLLYLSPHTDALPTSAIDSVYYYGFLITVGELAAAAFEIAGRQQSGIQPVLYNFGAGLLATGYAVFARLHLQNVTKAENPGSPEQVLESYLERSGLMLDNLEMAINRFASLAETAMEETQRVANKAQESVEKSATSATTAFDVDMRKALASTRESIDGIRAAMTDVGLIEERRAFAEAVRSSIQVSIELNTSLTSLAQGARAGSDEFQLTNAAMASLSTSATTLHNGLDKLTGDGGALVRVAAGAETASIAASQAATAALKTVTTMEDLSAKIADSGNVLGKLGRSADKAGRQVDGLVAACSRLDSSIAVLVKSLEGSDQLAGSLKSLGQEIPALAPKLHAVGNEFDTLKSALDKTARSLEHDVQRSAQAVALLADNLAAVAETIIERTRERRASA